MAADDEHPVLLVLERPFTSHDDSQRWIAAVLAAADPVTAAWAFTAAAAEEVAAVARDILGTDE